MELETKHIYLILWLFGSLLRRSQGFWLSVILIITGGAHCIWKSWIQISPMFFVLSNISEINYLVTVQKILHSRLMCLDTWSTLGPTAFDLHQVKSHDLGPPIIWRIFIFLDIFEQDPEVFYPCDWTAGKFNHNCPFFFYQILSGTQILSPHWYTLIFQSLASDLQMLVFGARTEVH